MEENSKILWKIWKKDQLDSEMIWKIWKKSKLNSEKIWKIHKKIVWKKIVKCFGKYGRKESRIVKRFGKYRTK